MVMKALNRFTYILMIIGKKVGKNVEMLTGMRKESRMETKGFIEVLDIVPRWQKKRLGLELMERTVEYFWRADIKTVEPGVKLDNIAALDFYQRHKFSDYPNLSAIIFEKRLEGGESFLTVIKFNRIMNFTSIQTL
ncbi:MAG: GNAT family N-acetyltransferase [Candidatus Hodarchaeales archaeon]|jgi:GNAT superfamily N-acetyltransferase